jgi:hypothetical protein
MEDKSTDGTVNAIDQLVGLCRQSLGDSHITVDGVIQMLLEGPGSGGSDGGLT